MKKNAAQREFKKLKSQINQIEEIVKNSKVHSLIEHEVAVRKKIQLLKEIEKEGFKEFDIVLVRYQELLELVSKRILEDYNRKNDTNFDFHEIISGNYNILLNSGFITLLTKYHIPKIIKDDFDKVFPENPKDEYVATRRMNRKFYIHLGDTNTGKTYNAINKLKEAKKGVYLSPLRILALENFERLNNEGILCDLSTGEEEILKEGANHLSCTIEKLNLQREYDVAVIDEIQMIGDSQRGAAWSRAVLGVRANEVHICGALNTKAILEKILDDCNEDYEIKEYTRNTPLVIEENKFNYKDAKEGDAVVIFSKKKVLEIAKMYSDEGIKTSIIYGDLPPETRRMQYEKFINGENKVLVTTDAIGMGVNLPIRRIIFITSRKFDGEEVRDLTSQEVKQIAGRAGRKGIYDIGYVASILDIQSFLRDKIEEVDERVKKAVLGPSDAILKIKSLSLKEKLALWSAREEKLDYYKKMDISEYIIILDAVKKYKLKEEEQWNLLKVAFDVSNEALMETFLKFVDEFSILKYEELNKPTCFRGSLSELEIYYQQINMYYSFSKVFSLNFDVNWVYAERVKVSNEINEILVKI